MNEVNEIGAEAIDAAACSRAAGPGVLEACGLYLSRHQIPAKRLPMFYCRLGEALLHKDKPEEAADCARIACQLRPDEEEIGDICAWIFSNSGRWDEAAATYERLLESRPGWVEGHRHASGAFAAARQLDRAIFHAGRASDLAPNSVEFALHAACQCEAAGRYEDAVSFFMRALAVAPEESSVLRQLSGTKFALGQVTSVKRV